MARASGIGGGIVPYAVPPSWRRSPRRLLVAAALAAAALALGACGEQGIQRRQGRPELRGRACSSTRTAPAATRSTSPGATGSATNVGSRELKDGPNFNERKETVDDVLYAIEQRRLLVRPDAAEPRDRRGRSRRWPSSWRSTPARRPRAAPVRRGAAHARPQADPARSRTRCGRRSRGAATAPTSGSTACSSSTSARARCGPRWRPCGRARTRRRRRSAPPSRRAATRPTRSPRCRRSPQRVKALGQELADADAELQAALGHAPEPARPDAPPTATRRCARWASAAAAGPDHLDVAGSLIDMEAGARVAGSRFAYLKGDLVLLELALFRWAMRVLAGARLRAGGAAGAGARGGAVRHRLPARHRAADLPAGRRRPVPGRHERGAAGVAARGRDPRRGRAAAALRGLLAVLPARGGRRRARHARHLPRAPVRQARDVQLRRAARRRPTSTSCCWRSRRSSCGRSDIPYRVVNIGADDLGASAAKKYDLEAWMPGPASGYREVTSTSNTTDFQSRRLDIRYRAGRRRATCTRSTAPRSPGAT